MGDGSVQIIGISMKIYDFDDTYDGENGYEIVLKILFMCCVKIL